MTCIDGFILPVPTEQKARYDEMATLAAALFVENGALRVVENWSDALSASFATLLDHAA